MALAKDGSARKRKLTPNGGSFLRGLYKPEMKMPEANVSALMFFDKSVEKQTLIEECEKHLWPLYRFNSVVVDGHFVPVDGPMDRDYHIMEKEVADEAEIDAHTQRVKAEGLDHKHPLWTLTILKAKKGRSAILVKINHSISDGLGLLFAMMPMISVEGGDPLSKIPLPGQLTGRKTASAPGQQKKKSILSLVCGIPKSIGMFFKGVMSLLIMKDDSEIKMNPALADRTPFLVYRGHHVFTRMPPVPMSAVKAVREKHGCTVNDTIMAALAGAIRKYGAEELKDPLLSAGATKALECKSFMLLGLPRPIDPKDPGVSLANNILTPVFRMPIDEPTALRRIQRTVAMCNDLKSMAYIMGIKLTTKLITAVAPVSIMRGITSEAISKVTANCTCVPLTTVPFTFAGQECKEVQALFVNNIPQISLLTYNGFIYWNIVHDPALIPNATALGQYFLAEFAEMAK